MFVLSIALVYTVPAWVLKTLMGLIALAGLGFAAWAIKTFSKTPQEQWQLAVGYNELNALKGKSPTTEEISDIVERANLDKDGTELLFNGFKQQYATTPTETLEKIISVLNAKLKGFSEDEDADE